MPRTVPGEVIVKFAAGAAKTRTVQAVARFGASMVAGPLDDFVVVRAGATSSVDDLIDQLEASPGVAYAEPNYLRYLSMTPNDARFDQQWAAHNSGQIHGISSSNTTRVGVADADMDLTEAWDTQQGSTDTVVAIMDSGIDVAHPDLADNIWVNDAEIAGNGVDDDGNGYRDDINGWDFADNDASLLHSAGRLEGWDHGTHVAGIVAAVAGNGVGVSGVCPKCKLMVLKIFRPFDTDGDGTKDTMVGDVAAELKAFDYAMSMGADVVNGSFGGSIVSTRAERSKIKSAIASGIAMVFAAGNENGDNDLLIPGLDFDGDQSADMTSPAYPASYDIPGIVSVAASNDSDQNGFQSACFAVLLTREWPCAFTNWGHESVDVSAPGVDILSTLPNDGYGVFDGTSMAAPQVAGVAGLIASQHPEYGPAEIANAIMNSTDKAASLQSLLPIPDVGTITGQFTTTGGRVNAAIALNASIADSYPTTDGNIGGAQTLVGTVHDNVAWPEDTNDVFKKKLAKGSVYKATLNATETADLDLQIYKPGASEIWQFDDRCFNMEAGCPVLFYEPTESGDVSVRFRAPKDGTFFFHVNAWVLNDSDYSIKVTKL
jgi:subtilisin family serine protease